MPAILMTGPEDDSPSRDLRVSKAAAFVALASSAKVDIAGIGGRSSRQIPRAVERTRNHGS